jgi:hypothetical protein
MTLNMDYRRPKRAEHSATSCYTAGPLTCRTASRSTYSDVRVKKLRRNSFSALYNRPFYLRHFQRADVVEMPTCLGNDPSCDCRDRGLVTSGTVPTVSAVTYSSHRVQVNWVFLWQKLSRHSHHTGRKRNFAQAKCALTWANKKWKQCTRIQ